MPLKRRGQSYVFDAESVLKVCGKLPSPVSTEGELSFSRLDVRRLYKTEQIISRTDAE